jgi:hypothetical protein
MSKPYPGDAEGVPDPKPIPITVCTPTWLGANLTLVRQRVTPTGPFLELLNGIPLEQLEEELAKIDSDLARLNTARQLLDLAISARKAANGDEAIATPSATAEATGRLTPIGTRPRLKQAILAVMAGAPSGYEWTPSDLHAALEARGWAPTTAAARSQISNRLGNLVESGQVRKPAKGLYVLVGNDGLE